MVGSGTKIPGLSESVLEDLYQTALTHHLGQTRKDEVGTDYIAHILGVVGIGVNLLGMRDINAVSALFLHDILEDSLMYFTEGDITILTKEEAAQLRETKPANTLLSRFDLFQTRRNIELEIEFVLMQINMHLASEKSDVRVDVDKILKYIRAVTKIKGEALTAVRFQKWVDRKSVV